MPAEIMIWSAEAHCLRTVRRPDPQGPMRFDPLGDAMLGELERRAFVSAMRFATPDIGRTSGPNLWQTAASDWDD